MKTVIDWSLDRETFRKKIKHMAEERVRSGKVIPLPMEPNMYTLMALLSHVNCEGCQALCCKPGLKDDVLSLTQDEFAKLGHHWSHHRKNEGFFEVPLPCPFLKDDKCTIYETRPLVCVLYPIDFGTADGKPVLALQSKCPESEKIAEKFYMAAYDIKRKMVELKGILN